MAFYQVTPDRDQPPGWRILSIFGIPVYVEPSFFMFLGLIVLFSAGGGPIDLPAVGLFCFVIFFSILIHELGHALVSKKFGCDSIRIALIMFGGYATHTPTTRMKSVIISLAGPAFGLTFGLAALAASVWGGPLLNLGSDGAMQALLASIIFINFFWTFFNLIPIYPLDGAQALFHGLTLRLAPNRAMVWVARLSMGLCIVLGLVAYQFGQVIVIAFFAFFFMDNLRILQALN
ncbi:hypothetical protein IIC65_06980 [Candidatus Sumerlaeota bacterium]|nr:hypothetical protein [Candidatus Sumerlaeota bacterium]